MVRLGGGGLTGGLGPENRKIIIMGNLKRSTHLTSYSGEIRKEVSDWLSGGD